MESVEVARTHMWLILFCCVGLCCVGLSSASQADILLGICAQPLSE